MGAKKKTYMTRDEWPLRTAQMSAQTTKTVINGHVEAGGQKVGTAKRDYVAINLLLRLFCFSTMANPEMQSKRTITMGNRLQQI